MPWLAVILLLCAVEYSTSCTGQEGYLNMDKGFVFDVLPQSTLSLPINTNDIQQQSTQVPDKKGCVIECIWARWCRSANFQTTAKNSGLHVCQMLSTDKHTHPNKMTPNQTFIHLSMKNPCAETPCLNGGTCRLQKNRQNYRCTCKKGFHGDNCQNDVDECSTGAHTCHADANCTNSIGSFTCQCKPGYRGNGQECTDVNECTSGVHTCHVLNARCTNNIGSFTCQCHPGFHGNGHTCTDTGCPRYTTDTDATRNVRYGSSEKTLQCDRNIIARWYRFGGAAGVRMSTSCIPTYRCSTHAPGWLNGTHPTVQQGTVSRKVCFHWSNNCCRWSRYINVHNCGGFFVYQFRSTPVCWLRYCGED